MTNDDGDGGSGFTEKNPIVAAVGEQLTGASEIANEDDTAATAKIIERVEKVEKVARVERVERSRVQRIAEVAAVARHHAHSSEATVTATALPNREQQPSPRTNAKAKGAPTDVEARAQAISSKEKTLASSATPPKATPRATATQPGAVAVAGPGVGSPKSEPPPKDAQWKRDKLDPVGVPFRVPSENDADRKLAGISATMQQQQQHQLNQFIQESSSNETRRFALSPPVVTAARPTDSTSTTITPAATTNSYPSLYPPIQAEAPTNATLHRSERQTTQPGVQSIWRDADGQVRREMLRAHPATKADIMNRRYDHDGGSNVQGNTSQVQAVSSDNPRERAGRETNTMLHQVGQLVMDQSSLQHHPRESPRQQPQEQSEFHSPGPVNQNPNFSVRRLFRLSTQMSQLASGTGRAEAAGTGAVLAVAELLDEEEQSKNIQHAQAYTPSRGSKLWYRKRFLVGLIVIVTIGVALATSLAMWAANRSRQQISVLQTRTPTTAPTNFPTTHSPTLQPTTSRVAIFRREIESQMDVRTISFNEDSFERAVEWYANEDPAYDRPDYDPTIPDWTRPNFHQRFVLIWLWFHSTNNGENPWISCNPAKSELNETDDCMFQQVANFPSTSLTFVTVNATRWMASASECEWVHVTCHESGDVQTLSFIGNGMGSRFPVFLSEIRSLETLRIVLNNIVGQLPHEILYLQNLVQLSFHTTQGQEIPSEMYNLTNLQWLGLNGMKGTISTQISQLTNLNVLALRGSSMSGTLPTEIAKLTKLYRLVLDKASYHSTIPTEYGNLSKLESFVIDHNQLTGTIPEALTNITSMKDFSVASNNVAGMLPNFDWPNCLELDVDDNSLSGNIPENIYLMSDLLYLRLGHNNFNGTVGEEISSLRNLKGLSLTNNKFTGLIPSSFENLEQLEYVELQNNQFDGIVADSLCVVQANSNQIVRVEADCLGPAPQNWCYCCTLCCGDQLGGDHVCQVRELGDGQDESV